MAGENRSIALMLAGVGLLGVLLAAACIALEPTVVTLLLGAPPTSGHRAVLAACPFYMLIAPLSAALLAKRRDARLVLALAVAGVTFALGLGLAGLDVAILASCAAFTAAAAVALS
jgi:hypothetical protein